MGQGLTHDVPLAPLLTTLDGLYTPVAKGVTNGSSHDHVGGDGANIPIAGGGTGATDAATARSNFNVLQGAVKTGSTTIAMTAGNWYNIIPSGGLGSGGLDGGMYLADIYWVGSGSPTAVRCAYPVPILMVNTGATWQLSGPVAIIDYGLTFIYNFTMRLTAAASVYPGVDISPSGWSPPSGSTTSWAFYRVGP